MVVKMANQDEGLFSLILSFWFCNNRKLILVSFLSFFQTKGKMYSRFLFKRLVHTVLLQQHKFIVYDSKKWL